MSEQVQGVWERLKQRAQTEEARRRVSVITMVLTGLREFLQLHTRLARMKAQTPQDVLDQIKAERLRLEQIAEKYPARLIQEMSDYLDSWEVGFLNFLLPNALRQAAADAISCGKGRRYGDLVRAAMNRSSTKQAAALEETRTIASDPARRREFLSEYLEQLRDKLNDATVRVCLNRAIAKGWTRDRRKTEGMSIKNWPVVGEHIWEVYRQLLPLYPSPPRSAGSRHRGPKPKLATFPQELLNDIVELFATEFPDTLDDLTTDDVRSRVQYALRPTKTKVTEAPSRDSRGGNQKSC